MMIPHWTLWLITSALIIAGSSVGVASRLSEALAADGDHVYTTNFSRPCPSGLGVGIAFDGTHLWYSCAGSNPDLYKADPLTGDVLGQFNIAGGLGALAWDGKRKKIWAGWGGGAGSAGDVRLIDPTTGSATIQFNAAAAVIVGLDDGLAYDAQDDSLYISDDVSTVIYHYSTDGVLLDSFSWAGSDCYNSGLAIGGDLLFQGSNGCNRVWVVYKADRSPVFNFSTGGARDEDLECDSVTFSPKTVMWSVEAYEPRRAVAFEIPFGSCTTGGGVDSDGDGLLDEWETHGVWIDPDGDGPLSPQFINLPEMGADPNKPDIFIHIDWMEALDHNHRLSREAIKKVVDAFAAAPYVSPTGSIGINLHIDHGPDSLLNFETRVTWGELGLSQARNLDEVNPLGTFSVFGLYNWSAFQEIKDAAGGFTESGRPPIFHYVISAHNLRVPTSNSQDPDSGISRDDNGLFPGIGGSDFIISLGSSAAVLDYQAGTLMHELGHNLNLRHGGDDGTHFKPNYLSVMNYSFQLTGVFKGAGGVFDYSRRSLPTLHEWNLDETGGLGPEAFGYGTRHFCGGKWVPVTDASGPIDWNCDADTTDWFTFADINGDGLPIGNFNGYDDWTNIKLKGGAIGLAGATLMLPTETEAETLTPEIQERILPWPNGGALEVVVDIKPRTSASPINLKSRELIPVAILSTAEFDARTINPLSVRFGPSGAAEAHRRGHLEDVDGNGDVDLVLHFDVRQSGIAAGQTAACLAGNTFGGIKISGCDVIRIVP